MKDDGLRAVSYRPGKSSGHQPRMCHRREGLGTDSILLSLPPGLGNFSTSGQGVENL